MFDRKIHAAAQPLFVKPASLCAALNISANLITTTGFLIGMICVPLLALGLFDWALACLLINRLFDGLDGAIAREQQPTNAGAYLDIVLDFVFYSAFVLGVCIAQPEHSVFGAFLIFSFVANGSSFLAFAIFAERLKLDDLSLENKSFAFLAGLAEGFETIVVFVLICLIPSYFWLLALVFGIACCTSAGWRIHHSFQLIQSRSV